MHLVEPATNIMRQDSDQIQDHFSLEIDKQEEKQKKGETMYKKKMPAKGLRPPKPKADLHALEQLPEDATSDQLKSAAVNVSLADLEERVADVQDQWEESSLFEDALDELTEEGVPATSGEFCIMCFILFFSFSFPHHFIAIGVSTSITIV